MLHIDRFLGYGATQFFIAEDGKEGWVDMWVPKEGRELLAAKVTVFIEGFSQPQEHTATMNRYKECLKDDDCPATQLEQHARRSIFMLLTETEKGLFYEWDHSISVEDPPRYLPEGGDEDV